MCMYVCVWCVYVCLYVLGVKGERGREGERRGGNEVCLDHGAMWKAKHVGETAGKEPNGETATMG